MNLSRNSVAVKARTSTASSAYQPRHAIINHALQVAGLGARAPQPILLQRLPTLALQVLLSTALVWGAPAQAAVQQQRDADTAMNVPGQLTSNADDNPKALSPLFNSVNRREVEGCTRKCTTTCVRGGDGSPGLGPVSLRKEVVVFKEGFRSRTYCLTECAELCSLAIDKTASPAYHAPPEQKP